jgi:hypothetical protein
MSFKNPPDIHFSINSDLDKSPEVVRFKSELLVISQTHNENYDNFHEEESF